MADFLPTDEPGIADWFDNYGNKMDAHGAEHGFNEDEIKQAKDDAVVVGNIVTGWQNLEAYRSDFSGFKRIMLYGAKNAATPTYPMFTVPAMPIVTTMLAGIIKRMRSNVRRLKESANYNEAVGGDFRVLPIKAEKPSDATAKPTLKSQQMADSKADLAFAKNGFDGIELEMQRGSDADAWNKLGRFYTSPAEDETPSETTGKSEVRRYRARYLRGNKAVGLHSDIVTVSTIP